MIRLVVADDVPVFREMVVCALELEDDLEVVRKVLTAEPGERPPFSYRIDGLGIQSCVIKVKKIACKSLKGRGANSGLRLIYAHFEEEKRIVMIELYHKNYKELEDRDL